jgi:hypothetical protein
MGAFTWLGGRTNPRDDNASKTRARDHRARIARETRDTKKRRQRDQTNRPWWNE